MGREDRASDFDFLIGRWKVKNRRLRERLKGSNALVARHIWGGRANTDEFEAEAPFGPIQGMTLRLFDPASRQWRLYWANSATGILDRPVVGSFQNLRGEFYNEDTHEGRSIYMRFIWSGITESSCRWEQAFSVDGGKTWETNWIMELTREP